MSTETLRTVEEIDAANELYKLGGEIDDMRRKLEAFEKMGISGIHHASRDLSDAEHRLYEIAQEIEDCGLDN